MFNEVLIIMAVAGLAMLAAGGIAYGLLFQQVKNESAATRRLEAITARPAVINQRKAAAELGAKKKSIQDALKELEEKQKAKTKQARTPPLQIRLQQAGLKWSKQTFYVVSLICAVAFIVLAYLLGAKPIVAAGLGVIGGIGLPRWYVGFCKKRRIAKFLNELPNAVDVIVRGIKSGLPLGDCMRIIANEAREPVKSEFRQIIETQQMGVTIGDATLKLFERMPVPEANFFGIVIAIQSKAGGNLSEALGNLSRVLRDRKKMKAKISAMSMEAKASASIIGSLPIIVSLLVYLTSPSYITILFSTKTGNLILLCGVVYMGIGIMVMRKMINFNF